MGTGPDGGFDGSTPADLYGHIESWWGSDLDDELIERIANAPEKHRQAFKDSLVPLNITNSELHEVPPGVLRPVLAANLLDNREDRRSTGIRLLLYAHEIVLDYLDFFAYIDRWEYGLYERPADYAAALRQLARIRPLVEDGTIKFSSTGRITPDHRDVSQLLRAPDVSAYVEQARENYNFLDIDDGDPPSESEQRWYLIYWYCGGLAAACRLAERHEVHILARSSLDQAVTRTLLQRPSIDNRQIALQKLAALNVPTMASDIDTLVKIRKSDADFAEWRNRLGEALTYVGELGEDEESLDEAAAVVHAQLSDGLRQIEKGIKKSPALQAVKGGVRGLMISGISATTGAALSDGDPWVGIASGAAGKVADSVYGYIEALKKRRKDRLILDVTMLFDTQQRVDN